jgi:hypothetical protein
MKKLLLLLLLAVATFPAFSQRALNPDSAVTTKQQVTIKGKRIAYNATTGMQPVWDENGKTIAGLFYT